jgi:hypothetical protein
MAQPQPQQPFPQQPQQRRVAFPSLSSSGLCSRLYSGGGRSLTFPIERKAPPYCGDVSAGGVGSCLLFFFFFVFPSAVVLLAVAV